MATAAVMPNWYRKRPETLDMNETGMKMMARLSVVAMTGSAISSVAALAAAKLSILFSSTHRKMFSSTTIASSMTMPTISISASIVTLLSVKSSARIMPNVEITEAGIATPGDDRRAPAAHEQHHDQARQDAAEHEVGVDFVQRVVDVDRLVLDDVELDVARQLRLNARHHLLDALDDGHRVRAGLPPHLHDHGRLAVEPRQPALLLACRPRPAPDVAHPQRHAARVVITMLSKSARRLDAAHRPQRPLLDVARDVAARQVGVLRTSASRTALIGCRRPRDGWRRATR